MVRKPLGVPALHVSPGKPLSHLYCLHLLHGPAGYTASQLFGQGVSYTYDDVIMHPGHISFGAHEVCCRLLWWWQWAGQQCCHVNNHQLPYRPGLWSDAASVITHCLSVLAELDL